MPLRKLPIYCDVIPEAQLPDETQLKYVSCRRIRDIIIFQEAVVSCLFQGFCFLLIPFIHSPNCIPLHFLYCFLLALLLLHFLPRFPSPCVSCFQLAVVVLYVKSHLFIYLFLNNFFPVSFLSSL